MLSGVQAASVPTAAPRQILISVIVTRYAEMFFYLPRDFDRELFVMEIGQQADLFTQKQIIGRLLDMLKFALNLSNRFRELRHPIPKRERQLIDAKPETAKEQPKEPLSRREAPARENATVPYAEPKKSHRPMGRIRFHCLERAPACGIRLDLAWGGGSENRKIMLGMGVTCPILRYHTPP